MSKTKHEKGEELAYIVSEALSIIDKYARPTKGSGNSTEIGDVINKYFFVECKNWNTTNVIIDQAIWRHLINQIPIMSKKIPLLIQKNNENRIFVSLDIKDFFAIVNKGYKQDE
jgi:hypothetical protein